MGKDIRERTYAFGLKVVTLCRVMPSDRVSSALCSQLVRSGTSIGANVEEAQDGMSRADFLKSMTIALKEARETYYWLRILKDIKLIGGKDADSLLEESSQLVKILVSIVKSTKSG